jgi:hypothetical protein
VRLAGMMQALAAMRVTLAQKTAPVWEGVRKSLPSWVPPTAELVLFAGANVISSSGSGNNLNAMDSNTASGARVVVSGGPLHALGGSIPFAITADDDEEEDGVDGAAPQTASTDSSSNLHNGDISTNDNVIRNISDNQREEQGSQVLAQEGDGISVAFDFKAESADEMDMFVGDSIARVEQAPDAEWVVVHKTNGQSGLVPKSYLKGLDTPTHDDDGNHSAEPRRTESPDAAVAAAGTSKAAAPPKHRDLLQSITGFSKDKLHAS